MLKLVFLLLVSSLLFITPVFAEESTCFDEIVARNMIVHIEKTANLQEQVELYKEANKELEYQVKLLKEVNSLQKEQVTQYKDLMKLQKEGYESIIKSQKPGLLDNIIKGIGFVGIGALLGLCL